MTDRAYGANIVDTIQHSLTDRIGKKRKGKREEEYSKPVINTEGNLQH